MTQLPHAPSISTAKLDAQVIVIGGGPAGLSMAALLASYDIDTICIDKDSRDFHLSAVYDGRTTAISYGSRNVLDHAGAWGEGSTNGMAHAGCPIRDIRILDGTSPVLMQFLSQEMDDKVFGWILENRDMRQALFARLDTLSTAEHLTGQDVVDIRWFDKYVEVDVKASNADAHVNAHADSYADFGAIRTLRASALIGADGKASITRQKLGITTRRWMYDQSAHICVVHHENPHDNVAYEHFREEGPFAILPMNDMVEAAASNSSGASVSAGLAPYRSAVVWSDHRVKSRQQNGQPVIDEYAFIAAMQTRFPDHYGRISLGQFRATYPLGLMHATSYIGPRTALVAEAAHAMHPIAGQGLNMSLRDVGQLAEIMIDAHQSGKDLAGEDCLLSYQRHRRFDNTMMLAATDHLTKLYASDRPLTRLARKIGVKTIAAIPPAKRYFMGQAMGLNGHLSKFVRHAAYSHSV